MRRYRDGRSRRDRKNQRLTRRVAALSMIALVLALALAIELVYGLLTSPRLAVAEVEIQGADAFSGAELAALAGIRPGTNIFCIGSGKICQRLRNNGWLESVKVHRRFPNRVVIEVKEAAPVLAVHRPDGSAILVSRQGGLFPWPGPKPQGLPEIKGIQIAEEQLGSRLNTPVIKAALALCSTLSGESRAKMSRVSVDKAGQVSATLTDGIQIKLGWPRDLKQKMHKLSLALKALRGRRQNIRYIDVSCPRAVVWQPKGKVE